MRVAGLSCSLPPPPCLASPSVGMGLAQRHKHWAATQGCLVAEAKTALSLTPVEMGQQKLALFVLTFPWVIASSLQGTGLLGRVPGFFIL